MMRPLFLITLRIPCPLLHFTRSVMLIARVPPAAAVTRSPDQPPLAMSTIHFLNVGKGDCTIIQHNSGRNTMVDICKGNYTAPGRSLDELIEQILAEQLAAKGGNFGMSKKPTNPLGYLKKAGITSLFRFILTHPDMDHLDGLDALMDACPPTNFWETGVRKEKPEFSNVAGYLEVDWDRYETMHQGQEPNLTVLRHLAGARFPYANRDADGTGGGDGLRILSPDQAIVDATNEGGEVNDASYVILYRSSGGKILIPGDAHDETWSRVLEHHADEVADCDVLFAPHHGRKSGADFSFLDTVRPRLTFFGCANSGHLAYNEWSSRDLPVITNNQAGNIVLESTAAGMDLFVENHTFAKSRGYDCSRKNALGHAWIGLIPAPQPVA